MFIALSGIGCQVVKIKRSGSGDGPVAVETKKMAPIVQGGDMKAQIQQLIDNNNVMIFSKSTCPFCEKVSSNL